MILEGGLDKIELTGGANEWKCSWGNILLLNIITPFMTQSRFAQYINGFGKVNAL
jgi:hypothetical protein